MSAAQPVKFSLGLGGANPSTPSSKPARPRNALFGPEDDSYKKPEAEEISGIDRFGGVIELNRRTKEPLVIPIPSNRKRTRSGLPVEPQHKPDPDEEDHATTTEAPMVFGLNIIKKEEKKQEDAVERQSNTVPLKEKDLDALALQALLAREDRNSGFVIPAVTEDEAFHRDYEEAPDVPTAADYDRIPPEEFGVAMLRGMGWKDGEAIGKNRGERVSKIRQNERRPALLGLGAKPIAATGIELGIWGKNDPKAKKNENSYNPVILRNKKTGETLTEAELQARIEQQKKQDLEVEEEKRSSEKERRSERNEHRSSRKSSKYDHDRRDRDKRRDRERDRERDADDRDRRRKSHRSRSPHQRRERSRSKEQHRRKHYDDDYRRSDRRR